MTTTFKDCNPIKGKILIKDDDAAMTTDSGLYLPDQRTNESIVSGTVLKTSVKRLDNGVELPLDVQPGDKVLYSFHAGGRNIEVEDNETHRIVEQVELIAIVVE